MDWLTFIAEMTKALSWPVAVAGVLLFYRRTLLDMAARVSELRYGSFGATFERNSAQIADTVNQIPELPPPTQIPTQPELMDLANREPAAAIARSWQLIEEKIQRLLGGGGGVQINDAPLAINALVASRRIDQETARSLRGLNQLRNLTVHAPEGNLTADRAKEYVVLASAIIYVLDIRLGLT